MAADAARAIHWVEQGYVPDRVVRLGIRRLLAERLKSLDSEDLEAWSARAEVFAAELSKAPLAPHSDTSRAQHYELPPEFFGAVLGRHRKYSCAWWGETPADPAGPIRTLDEAEEAALQITCERAGIEDGQQILELGCGWGSLSLWLAQRYPHCQITAMSHAHAQRLHIEAQAQARGLRNLRVQTSDFNGFEPEGRNGRFDRVVSVEMFEHLRNWPQAFERVARWLAPEGRFFMHVFAVRGAPYAFEDQDASDWMSRHFFTGGMMPSDDLPWRLQDHLRVEHHWRWSGQHYERTAEAWLQNMDASRERLWPIFEATYGAADAALWWQRWRLFFLAVAELFGHAQGQRWHVGHYLFSRRGPA